MKPLALEWLRKQLNKGRRDLMYAQQHDRPTTDIHNLQAKVMVLEWLQELARNAKEEPYEAQSPAP